MFSTVEDPDYAGHVILEQFQAQVTPSILIEIRRTFVVCGEQTYCTYVRNEKLAL
jgi:hypothetical protein